MFASVNFVFQVFSTGVIRFAIVVSGWDRTQAGNEMALQPFHPGLNFYT